MSQVGITPWDRAPGAIGEKLDPRLNTIREWAGGAGYLAVPRPVVAVVLTYVSLIRVSWCPLVGDGAGGDRGRRLRAPDERAGVFARPLVRCCQCPTDVIIRMILEHEEVGGGRAGGGGGGKRIPASGAQEGVFHESEQKIVERVFRG